MKVASLFSGIGGIERGLEANGFETVFFCESDPIAQAVLSSRFDGVSVSADVGELTRLPTCDLITAGFPCQDLSQAGGKRGIGGSRSSLVGHLFDLLEGTRAGQRPPWLLIENVPYMLRLNRGQAMDYLTDRLNKLGYEWAFRIVDARSLGLPQRRPRVILLAALDEDPATVLFEDDHPAHDFDGRPSDIDPSSACYGFYWTEGLRGIGWAREGVPPIKCGSTIGIASPPAVWFPRDDFVGMLDIRDAERLQGFPAGYTDFEQIGIKAKASLRWRLVGNAVSTRVSQWVGSRLTGARTHDFMYTELDRSRAWPNAAFSRDGIRFQATVGGRAGRENPQPLSEFLRYPLKPLSVRATTGFLGRAHRCTNVVYAQSFLDSLRSYAEAITARSQ